MKNKAKVKILAKAVYQALVNKNKKETESIVDNFVAYLKQHHFLPLLEEILAELKVLEQADKNILRKKRLEFTPKILNDILVGKKSFW